LNLELYIDPLHKQFKPRYLYALPFYFGAVALGLIVPIASFAYFDALSSASLTVVALLSLLGDFSIIYCIAKAGLYRPLPI
jgi:hypothetical protein